MLHEDFSYIKHGFAGHLAEPDNGSDRAVIVIMGGEQSLLPGIKIAERLADYGITGLAVSLFGAEGIPDSPNQCPLEMFEPAVKYLRDAKKIAHISTYGQSMGSVFAALTAQYIGGIENVVMVSPSHVPFEGTTKDKKTMTGHSVATWRGRDIPFVKPDFGKVKMPKYYRHSAARYKVMGMWIAFYDAYRDKTAEKEAFLPLEKTGARILLIAGGADEAWPAEYSVNEIRTYLENKHYEKEVRAVVYPNVSHLTGMMPNREREKKLYRMIPVIGFLYRSFGKYKKECMKEDLCQRPRHECRAVFEIKEREIRKQTGALGSFEDEFLDSFRESSFAEEMVSAFERLNRCYSALEEITLFYDDEFQSYMNGIDTAEIPCFIKNGMN